MKKLIILFFIVAVFAGCGGSSSVDKAIDQVEKALVKVEKNKGKMTEEDWKALEKEVETPLKVISDALDSDKVGVIGKTKILAVTAKWATVLAEAGVIELEKRTDIAMENWGTEFEKATKELEESGMLQDLEKAAQELKESNLGSELEKAVRQLQTITEQTSE